LKKTEMTIKERLEALARQHSSSRRRRPAIANLLRGAILGDVCSANALQAAQA
jgi:hypothetical protein